MSEIGKYIYGIIPRPCSGEVNFRPFEHEKTSQQAGGVTVCEQIYAISYQDISAVVSDSEVIDYNCIVKDAVARYLLRHQQVIEGIMPEHTIIPMRLGTFAQNEDEVRDILNKGYRVSKEIFAKICDKIEIDVAATWSDSNSVLKEVGEEKEIREFKGKLLSNPKGIAVDDQMKVGVMVKKALDEKREECAFEIQNALKSISQDFRPLGLMDDKMVVNSAFLINKAGREDFDRKIEELNAKFAEKLNFRSVGPLPPYSFYTLEIKKMRFEQIDWARKRLGLNDFVSKDEIKKAHQRLVFSLHPDKNPDTAGIEEEFDDVNKAHKIIEEFCRACEQTVQFEKYSFKKEECEKNAILVRTKE